MKFLYILLLMLLVTAQSCNEPTPEQVTVISPQEMRESLNEDRLLQLLDVRTTEEYEVGHLRDSQNICVTDSDFKEKAAKLDKNKPVYVYCKKGGRSAKAAKILTEMGFKEIYDLDGGITAWDEAGLETEKR